MSKCKHLRVEENWGRFSTILYHICFNVTASNYLGCYNDQYDPTGLQNPAPRVLPDGVSRSDDMTIGYCINFCIDLGNLRYAGVEFGTECWCGNADADYSQLGQRPDTACSRPCSGDMSQTCGAYFLIQVYDRRCYFLIVLCKCISKD